MQLKPSCANRPLRWVRGIPTAAGVSACLAWLAAGCAPAAAYRRGSGDTLRLALRTDVNSLDPAIAYDLESWPLVRLVNQGLLDYDDGTNLVPWLARELPSVSPDGRTFTFRLRPGIRFSNGRELAAADYVYTLERILDPATRSPGDGFFRNIVGARAFQAARARRGAGRAAAEPAHVSGLRAPDRYTLQIRLEQPDLSFANVMALPFTYAVPREEVARHGQDFYRHPVGTGPFVLREWRRGLRIRFARNPFYAQPDPVRLRAVEVLVGADELVQQMMFERGELDLAPRIPDPDFIRVTTDPRLRACVQSMPASAVQYLAMNCELKPFDDRRVRQAMNHALNQERLLRVLNRQGLAARGVLPPPMAGFSPGLPDYPYDPDRARELLRAAGYPSGFSVPLWLSADDARSLKMAQAVQQDLAQVGVRVELRPVAGTIFGEATGRRKHVQLCHGTWYQDYPDPSNFLDVLLSGDRIVDVHCNNKAFYSNPRVNALLRSAARETDRARRLRQYQEVERRVVEDAPWVFLYFPKVYMLHQPWLKGMKMHPVWPNRYERLWIEGA